jgi:hypothetical protein
MKKYFTNTALLLISLVVSVVAASAQSSQQPGAPFLGWNSYDCYGSNIDEKHTVENLDAFIEKLKPFGYEYFVLDAGWYRHFDLKPEEIWPTDGDKAYLNIDKYGRFIPSEVLFPGGLKAIIDKIHNHDIKFGLHMMRGIPREAVQKNTPIMGTEYSAQDIADTTDICAWSSLMYGVDMDKPGAQEYYNSVLELLASWGIDFIKYDDIVHKPREINAVADAIEKTGQNIVLSISPGNDINPEYYKTYGRADMIRITRDIWDRQSDIDMTFERWEQIQPYADKGFWLDMDMIPFGHIRINYPLTYKKLKSSRGYDRMDNFSYAQKKTFITQRAMAASPLFMGGALTTSPKIVFELITDGEMLACNQNGVTGKLIKRISTHAESIDVWKTNHKKNKGEGWIGIFNRNPYKELIKFEKDEIGLEKSSDYYLYDIWRKNIIEDGESFIFEIPGNDVVFIKYKMK